MFVRPDVPRRLYVAAHLGVGALCIAFLLALGWPPQRWELVLNYGGIGLAFALLPWLGPRLQRIPTTSLATPLAGALVLAATIPLIVSAVALAEVYEAVTTEQTLTLQEALAVAVAQDVTDYVGLHRAAVVALAAQPRLATMSAAERRAVLEPFQGAYREIL